MNLLEAIRINNMLLPNCFCEYDTSTWRKRRKIKKLAKMVIKEGLYDALMREREQYRRTKLWIEQKQKYFGW